MLDTKQKNALKASYVDLIAEKIGGEIVPGGVAIHDASGEWVVITPVVKKSYDIDGERALMVARAEREAEKAAKAAEKDAE